MYLASPVGSVAGMPAATTRIALPDRYRVVRHIANGGMAGVWAAGAFASGPLHLGRIAAREVREVQESHGRPIIEPIIIGAALAGVFVLGALVVREIEPLADQIRNVLGYASKGSLPVLVVVTAVNGIAEELFFRGAAYAAITRHPVTWTTVAYTVATAATGKHLEDYVLGADTAHVVVEWSGPDGRTLVTGAVYEWAERSQPADPTRDHDRLTSRWYVFTAKGRASLDTLPFTGADGRPTPLREFAAGKQALLVVEEKRSLVEMQTRDALYNLPGDARPRRSGDGRPPSRGPGATRPWRSRTGSGTDEALPLARAVVVDRLRRRPAARPGTHRPASPGRRAARGAARGSIPDPSPARSALRGRRRRPSSPARWG